MGLDALHAEMVACLMGEKMAAELWIGKVIIETDYAGEVSFGDYIFCTHGYERYRV